MAHTDGEATDKGTKADVVVEGCPLVALPASALCHIAAHCDLLSLSRLTRTCKALREIKGLGVQLLAMWAWAHRSYKRKRMEVMPCNVEAGMWLRTAAGDEPTKILQHGWLALWMGEGVARLGSYDLVCWLLGLDGGTCRTGMALKQACKVYQQLWRVCLFGAAKGAQTRIVLLLLSAPTAPPIDPQMQKELFVAAVEGLAAAEAAQAEQKLDRADSGNQAESAAAQQQQQQQQQPGQHRLSRTSSASIAAPTLPPTSAVGQDRGRARRHARGHGLVEHIPSGPHACFELVLPLCYPIKTQAQQPQGGAAATGQQGNGVLQPPPGVMLSMLRADSGPLPWQAPPEVDDVVLRAGFFKASEVGSLPALLYLMDNLHGRRRLQDETVFWDAVVTQAVRKGHTRFVKSMFSIPYPSQTPSWDPEAQKFGARLPLRGVIEIALHSRNADMVVALMEEGRTLTDRLFLSTMGEPGGQQFLLQVLKDAPDSAVTSLTNSHALTMRVAKQGSAEMIEALIARGTGLPMNWHIDALTYVAERGEVRGVRALLSPKAFSKATHCDSPLIVGSIVENALQATAMRAAETALAMTAHLRKQKSGQDLRQTAQQQEGEQQQPAGQQQQQQDLHNPTCTSGAPSTAAEAAQQPGELPAFCLVYHKLQDQALIDDHPKECPSCCARLQERLHTILGLLRQPFDTIIDALDQPSQHQAEEGQQKGVCSSSTSVSVSSTQGGAGGSSDDQPASGSASSAVAAGLEAGRLSPTALESTDGRSSDAQDSRQGRAGVRKVNRVPLHQHSMNVVAWHKVLRAAICMRDLALAKRMLTQPRLAGLFHLGNCSSDLQIDAAAAGRDAWPVPLTCAISRPCSCLDPALAVPPQVSAALQPLRGPPHSCDFLMLLLEHGAPFGLVLNAPTLDAEHECVDTQQLCQLIVLAGEWAAQQEAKARQAELEAPPVVKMWDDFFGWLTPEGEPIIEPQRPWQLQLDMSGDRLVRLVADAITLTALDNPSCSTSDGSLNSNLGPGEDCVQAAVGSARAALRVLLERFGCRPCAAIPLPERYGHRSSPRHLALLNELLATYTPSQLHLGWGSESGRAVTAFACHGPVEALNLVLEAGGSRDTALLAVVGPKCDLPVAQRIQLVTHLMGAKCDVRSLPGHSLQHAGKCDRPAALQGQDAKAETSTDSPADQAACFLSQFLSEFTQVTGAEVTPGLPAAQQQQELEVLSEAVRGGVPQIVLLLVFQVGTPEAASKAFEQAIAEGLRSIVKALLGGPWTVITPSNALDLVRQAVVAAADVDPTTDTPPPTSGDDGSAGAGQSTPSPEQRQQEQEQQQGAQETLSGGGGEEQGALQEGHEETVCTAVDRLGVLHLLVHAAAKVLQYAAPDQPPCCASAAAAAAPSPRVTASSTASGSSIATDAEQAPVSSAPASAAAPSHTAQPAQTVLPSFQTVTNTALVAAAGAGAVAAVQYLIRLGADPLSDWEASIRAAAGNNQISVIEDLVKYGCSKDVALYAAVVGQQWQATKYLLSIGASPYAMEALTMQTALESEVPERFIHALLDAPMPADSDSVALVAEEELAEEGLAEEEGW